MHRIQSIDSNSSDDSNLFNIRHPSPISIEPIGVEPISIEPISVEPIGIEPIGIEPINIDKKNTVILDESDLSTISEKLLSSKISNKVPKLNLDNIKKRTNSKDDISSDFWILDSHK